MSALDFDAFDRTPLTREPFPFLIVPGFVKAEARAAIHRDYPQIDKPGSFPTGELTYGPAFRELLAELEGPAMARHFSEKFGMDLETLPTMVTVRGQAREKDGQIHTDSKTKVITVLIYMNAGWEAPSGRLRLLRSSESLDDMIAEVPPDEGTLLAFKVTENSWHGHKPFVGQRRAIQLNWVTGEDVVKREQRRHALSARIKKLWPFG
ncbi:MAG TPA: 2OG-Fe(II) oxygenase [Alphaproteobacteria bacterium]|nr:2OG-Fe(II) oxygenase [Alphaproteobacteria bacterium]